MKFYQGLEAGRGCVTCLMYVLKSLYSSIHVVVKGKKLHDSKLDFTCFLFMES